MISRSQTLFERAQQSIPGGVNSPVRAFKAVGGTPRFIESATGAFMVDADGNRYIDYVGSWGPMIAGHAHPAVLDAVREAIETGLSFGAPTSSEIEMAETLCRLVPSLEQVRMVSSGTEATMSAIRLARGHTGRDKILKFEGCYHGHGDALLVKAGSGALTFGVPNSPGVPASYAEHTLTTSFNDLAAVEAVFAEYGDQLACIIVEPVPGNMNLIPPAPGFLQGLREVCDRYGSLLIFDEVMSGFRVALGGAQEVFGVAADLITLGKIVGGGMPVGAFGGKREIMQSISPVGGVYQAGTLSGNPVAMAAGLATIQLIQAPNFYDELSRKTAYLLNGLQAAADAAGVDFTTSQVGGMFGMFFTDADSVSSYAEVMQCDGERFKRFFHGMLDQGVYLAPSAFEAGFVSQAHTQTELDDTITAARAVFAAL